MSSGFITETEIAEARKKRQEEWERVRKPDDPLVKPEDPYDHRSLYERLQEQKQKKDLEYEEAHKLKNMIKGLDDDEIEFLDLVDRTKLAADRKKELEEEQELMDYRNRVAALREKTLEERLQTEKNVNKPKAGSNKTSQQKLLKGIVVRKADPNKRKSVNENDEEIKRLKVMEDEKEDEINSVAKGVENNEIGDSSKTVIPSGTGLQCIGILPGLGCYSESTSDESSDSEVEQTIPKIDMLGRKVVEKNKES